MKNTIKENLEPTLKRILEAADNKGINDSKLAELLGLKASNKSVDSWKRGNSKAYFQLLPQLCKILEVSADYLLGLTDNPAPHYE
ncbi:MAG: helix-turn-helix domain-containing protein [Firmicutes bacterium]|nr:helix-turn-helix domain-containing protein [Bacillota bacterium]